MRIKELQIYGFKSFPHKTTIRFSRGISAIIGPNGCGKSNVLDALRWVLGEQSFSTLRCGKNEDVVFGGTASVPALGYAEVRLIMDNPTTDDGRRTTDDERRTTNDLGSEIEIRRRYFRSGESEYFLNRNPCRLKDIQDVFFNSGTGTKAYSIFDLSSLRAIIAGELRPMFEEAATLAKYRERRTDCLRKLELTDADLLRLNDIVAERERVARSLKRQAYRLSAYDRLKHEEKQLRLQLLRREYVRAKALEQSAREALQAGEAADALLLDRVQKIEGELDAVRRELATGRERRDRLQQEIDELKSRAARAETRGTVAESENAQFQQQLQQLDGEERQITISLREKETGEAGRAQEQAALGEKVAGVEGELAVQRASTSEQENRLLAIRQSLARIHEENRQVMAERVDVRQSQLTLEARMANAEDYRKRLTADLEQTTQRAAQLETSLTALSAELRTATTELETAQARLLEQRQELGHTRGRREELAQEIVLLNGKLLQASQELAALQPLLGTEQRSKAEAGLGPACLGRLVDLMTVQPGYEPAVEAVLTGLLDYFVLQLGDKASGSVAQWPSGQVESLDRSVHWGLIVDDGGRARGDGGSNTLTGRPSGQVESLDHLTTRPLDLFVEFKPDAPAHVRSIIADSRLVDSLERAWQLHVAQPGLHYVTRDGIAVLDQGIVVLESAREGRLSAARRAREMEESITELKQSVSARETEGREAEERSKVLALGIDRDDANVLELVNRRSRLDAECSGLTGSLTDLNAELHRQRSERSAIQQQLDELQAAIQQLAGQLQQHESRAARHEQEGAQTEHEMSELELAVKSGLEQSAQTLLELTRMREQFNAHQHELELNRQEIGRERERLAQIHRRRKDLQQAVEQRREESERCRAESAELKVLLDAQATRLAAIDLARTTEQEDRMLKEFHAAREEQEAARQHTLDLRLSSMEAEHRRTELEQEAMRVYGADLKQAEVAEEEEVKVKVKVEEEEEEEETKVEEESLPLPSPLPVPVEERLRLVTARLERLGRVNPLAGDEYRTEKEELDKLVGQRADVLGAKDNLLKTIAEIDRFAREQFLSTFSVVREGFREIFARLFVEGEADLILAQPNNPLESEIGIIARPKGKSPKRLDQLSDGEKALLALSLLFAFYRVKPAPFCFLDEVDAPLDDANVDRFARFLKELSDKTQVVIITHNRATVEQADILFGVTMEEPGVSKILSVKLGDMARSEQSAVSSQQ
jgi:chromosome segregation protein